MLDLPFRPAGRGAAERLRFQYEKNRHALTPEDSTSKWADLILANKLGDALYFVHSHDFIAVVAPASGLTIPELLRKYGAASTAAPRGPAA